MTAVHERLEYPPSFSRPPQLPVVGPLSHGVSLYAAQLSSAVADPGPASSDALSIGDRCTGPVDWEQVMQGTSPVHLHFTDRLFGSTPASAAEAVVEVARRRPTTVTLHDLPQPADGRDQMPGRAAAYRRVVESVRAVVCNSEHEAALLADFTRPAITVEPQVIPLPVFSWPRPDDAEHQPIKAVAILGYFYPGKGHSEVVDAVAAIARSQPALTADLHILALGAPSPGHAQDARWLADSARRRAIPFTVTGYLERSSLSEYCHRVAVPIAAHQHVSASGSVNSWIGHGRKPLVPNTRYFREMARLRPGTMTLFRPNELEDALIHRLENPASSWILPEHGTGPDLKDVVAQYLSWWHEVTW